MATSPLTPPLQTPQVTASVVGLASSNIALLVGSVEGIMEAFPATNADGSANPKAQVDAIQGLIKGLIDSGMFQLPLGVSITQIQAFAPSLVGVIAAYKAATGKVSL